MLRPQGICCSSAVESLADGKFGFVVLCHMGLHSGQAEGARSSRMCKTGSTDLMEGGGEAGGASRSWSDVQHGGTTSSPWGAGRAQGTVSEVALANDQCKVSSRGAGGECCSPGTVIPN